MIGIGELRTWLAILRDALLARMPTDLVLANGRADDKRLDAHLLRAAALSAAGYWIYGAIMQRIGAASAVAPLAGEIAAVREAAGALPLPGVAQILSMAVTLALIALFVWLLIRLSGRVAQWREVAAATLGIYLVFVVWRVVSGWVGLKVAATSVSSVDPSSGLIEAAPGIAMNAGALALVVAAVVLPAIAFGRAARLVAPGLRRPFLGGVLAWVGVMASDLVFTVSGAQRLFTQAFVPPT
ncbi:hypothetical protein [Elioraea sp.]|uniref:hypothetical protein n=1 Tax=Elioraea sp. TaxID=2185103 RepID=UPI003F707112